MKILSGKKMSLPIVRNSDKVLELVLRSYGFRTFRVIKTFSQGYINDVFLIETGRKRFVVKERDRSVEKNLDKNFLLIKHLHQQKIPVIKILPSINNNNFLVYGNSIFEVSEYIENTNNIHHTLNSIKKASLLFSRMDKILTNPPPLDYFPSGHIFSKQEVLDGLTEYASILSKKIKGLDKI